MRAELSSMLREVQAVRIAFDSASAEVKQLLAQSFGELGEAFAEFRWMLDEVQHLLIEIQANQVTQIGMQKVQLDLQRQVLAKTNLLLRRQQDRVTIADTAHVESEPVNEEQAEGRPPYKGLESFQPEDGGFFFGREALVAELSARLAEAPLLAVVGASGSGKSSVVRAGLLPALWDGALPGSEEWQHTILLNPGPKPLEELAVRFAVLLGVPAGSLLADLVTDPSRLRPALRQLLLDEPEGSRVVLVVDQFEEIFTLCKDEDERRAFIAALIAIAAREQSAVVVLAVRADFYARCTTYPALAAALQDRQAIVGPMNEDELSRAVELPAARVGLSLEPGLTALIVQDVQGEPGGLPLLSHALLETWKRRRGRVLTVEGYIESGGVRGAIAKTADDVLAHRLPSEEHDIVRSIFLRLTELGQGTEDTRRRVRRDELTTDAAREGAIEHVLGTLVEARLVTAHDETVEVAHEALIREWPTLRRWLDEDREGLLIHRRLTQDANEWLELNREPSLLYREGNLARASEWSRGRQGELNKVERSFLAAGQRREQRQRRLKVVLVAALALLAAGAALAAGYAVVSERDAREQSRLAISGGLAAQALGQVDQQLDQALLLSLEAYRTEHTLPARRSVFAGLEKSGPVTRFIQPTGELATVAVSPSGRMFVSAEGSLLVRRDTMTGDSVGKPLRGHGAAVTGALFSADGMRIVSADDAGEVIRWDADSGALLDRQTIPHDPQDQIVVVPSPDGRMAAIAINEVIHVWDLDARRQTPARFGGQQALLMSLAFDPSGEVLASSRFGGEIALSDVSTGDGIASWRGRRGATTDPRVQSRWSFSRIGRRRSERRAMERPERSAARCTNRSRERRDRTCLQSGRIAAGFWKRGLHRGLMGPAWQSTRRASARAGLRDRQSRVRHA